MADNMQLCLISNNTQKMLSYIHYTYGKGYLLYITLFQGKSVIGKTRLYEIVFYFYVNSTQNVYTYWKYII